MVKKLLHKVSLSTVSDSVIIFLVSLLPVLWLWGGYVILGHDAGTPISPDAHFLDRLYTWTHRYGLGDNQTFAVPGFFLHGFEYVLSLLPVSLSTQQSISFVIYFLLMGFSMYLFARALFPKRRYLPLFAAVFYQANHFILQAWFIAERTKFTTYIALPLILLYQYYFLYKKKNGFMAAVMTSLTVWILNGGGFLPLFGAILIIVPVFILFLLLESDNKKSFLAQTGIYIVTTVLLSLGLHSFWLIPYYSYISSSFGSEIAKSGGIEGVIHWVSSISLYTSLLNEFRLQGIQEWYVNEFHPYAKHYLQNPLFIALSFLIPIAAFGSLLLKKKRWEQKLLMLFGLLALVSMVFMAGSHAPFGDFYILMLKKIPGFIAFRTPFYKFAPGLWLSYAILLGFAVDYLWRKIPAPPTILKGIITLIIIGYTFPILNPTFFNYHEGRSTRVRIPNYVHAYADWANSKEFSFRRLLIMPPIDPQTNAHVTDWGYWSLASIHSLLDRNSYVNRGLSYQPHEKKLIDNLYGMFEAGDPAWKSIARALNIDGIVLYEDIPPYKAGKTISPELYKGLIQNDSEIKKEKEFGAWSVYRIAETKEPVRLVSSYYYYNDARTAIATPIYDLPIDMSDSLYLSTDPALMQQLRKGTVITANCIHCTLIDVPSPRGSTDIRVLPGSKFYSLKLEDEQRSRAQITDIASKVNFELENSWKRLNEIERLIVSNAPSDKKSQAWQLYAEQQEILFNTIQEIDTNTFRSQSNNLVALAYDTIKLQNSMVRDRVNDVSGNVDEGRGYLESLQSSDQLLRYLSEVVHYTRNLTEKKMSLAVPSNGTYEIFVQNEFREKTQDREDVAALRLLNKTYPIRPTDDPWIKVAETVLQKGEYPFTLTIPQEIQNQVLKLREEFSYNAFEHCKNSSLGSLLPGTYQFEAQVSSTNSVEAAMFIVNEDFQEPLLPYWGNLYTIPANSEELIQKTFVVEHEQPHNLYFCLYQSNRPHRIVADDISVYRIANPNVVFIQQPNTQTVSSKRTVTINDATQTKYHVTIPPGEETILMLDQRYNNLWNFTYPDSEHILGNMYANSWYIPASDETIQAEISFASQAQLRKGWMITISTFILVMISTTIYLMKRP